MSSKEQDAWVTKVLGMPFPATSLDNVPPPPPLKLRRAPRPRQVVQHASIDGLALWRDAQDAIDNQLDALSGRLLAAGDPDLAQVGALGPASVAKRLDTGLREALVAVDVAAAAEVSAAKARARNAVAAMRSLLDSDGLIRLLDTNGWGVPVSVRATMGAALDELNHMLDR